MIPFLDKVDEKKALKFLEKQRTAIEKLLTNGALVMKDLHDIRKRIKTLYFARKSVFRKDQSQIPVHTDALTDLLGKWHDGQVIINHLEKTMKVEKLNPKEIAQISKLKTKISRESELWFKKIKLAIPKSEFCKRENGKQ